MSSLADTGSELNLGKMYYRQSVTERHPNLVLRIMFLKDLDDLDPFNVGGVDGGK